MKKQEPITLKIPEVTMKTIEVPQIVTDMVASKVQSKVQSEVAKVKEKKDDVITRVMNYEHTPIIAAAAVGFLAGVIVGFAVSPVKRGVNVLSNNDLHTEEFAPEDVEDDEEEELAF